LEVDVGAEQLDCVGNEPLRCPDTGKVVGFTTSGCWGALTGKSLALGFVGPDGGSTRWADGHRLTVDLLGKRYNAFIREDALMEPAGVRDRKAAERTKRDLLAWVESGSDNNRPMATV